MKRVFILSVSWAYNGDSGHDIVGVFADKENAIKRLKMEAESEKCLSWFAHHFDNELNFVDKDDTSIDFEESDTKFYFHDNWSCNFMEFWIDEHNIE